MTTWRLKPSTLRAVILAVELSANTVLDCLFCYNLDHIKIGECLLPFNLLKPTGDVMHQNVEHSTIVRSAHTAFMCFVFISEQTATCATYSINWLVFIAQMKSVYSAVRTGDLNVIRVYILL